MGPLDFLLHLAGFLAPAVFMALVLPLAGRLVLRRQAMAWGFGRQALLLLACGTAVLAAGLWGFGRDGKMLTYTALVLACATAQWLSLRAWR